MRETIEFSGGKEGAAGARDRILDPFSHLGVRQAPSARPRVRRIVHRQLVGKAVLLSALIVGCTAFTAIGQTSSTYSLEEATLNSGGRPQNSASPASASYSLSLEAIGEFVVSRGSSSTSFVSDASFLVAYPAPREVTGVSVAADKQTIAWQPEPSVGRYNVYRGALTAIGGLDYGSCHEQGIAGETTSDADLPPAADGYYYIVTAENRLHEEGTKGNSTVGIERQGTACP